MDVKCEEVQVKWPLVSYLAMVLCTFTIVVSVMVSQVVFYRQIRLDMVDISNRWEHEMDRQVSSVQVRLDRLPPKELVEASTQALKLAVELEHRVDELEDKSE